jgi:UDP-2,4-diacetamido-2,4,6-trideoxy-beta-L-altropyranose hydrolase
MKIAFRVDSSPHHSPSRLSRSLALSSGLKDSDSSCEITFLLTGPKEGEELIASQGHQCRHLGITSLPAWNREVTANALDELKADMLIVDDPGIDRAYLQEMRSKAFVIAIDDSMMLESYCVNGIVNPNPNAHTFQYRSEGGEQFLGTEFAMIPKEFDDYQDMHRENPERVRRIFVGFPGSDRHGATLGAVRLLKELPERFVADIFVSRDFAHGEELAKEIGLDDRFIFMNDGPGKERKMAAADFAIAPPDMTFQELMMLRVPSALISNPESPGQSSLGEYVGMNGFALYLGEAGAIESGSGLRKLLADMDARERISMRAGELVDGLGRFRLADELFRLANPSSADGQ